MECDNCEPLKRKISVFNRHTFNIVLSHTIDNYQLNHLTENALSDDLITNVTHVNQLVAVGRLSVQWTHAAPAPHLTSRERHCPAGSLVTSAPRFVTHAPRHVRFAVSQQGSLDCRLARRGGVGATPRQRPRLRSPVPRVGKVRPASVIGDPVRSRHSPSGGRDPPLTQQEGWQIASP